MENVLDNMKRKLRAMEVIVAHLETFGKYIDDMAKEDFCSKVADYAVLSLRDVRDQILELECKELKRFILKK